MASLFTTKRTSLLADTDVDAKYIFTAMTAGAVGGYTLIRYFTRFMLEKPRPVLASKETKPPRLSFSLNPIPIIEPQFQDDKLDWRARFGLLNARF